MKLVEGSGPDQQWWQLWCDARASWNRQSAIALTLRTRIETIEALGVAIQALYRSRNVLGTNLQVTMPLPIEEAHVGDLPEVRETLLLSIFADVWSGVLAVCGPIKAALEMGQRFPQEATEGMVSQVSSSLSILARLAWVIRSGEIDGSNIPFTDGSHPMVQLLAELRLQFSDIEWDSLPETSRTRIGEACQIAQDTAKRWAVTPEDKRAERARDIRSMLKDLGAIATKELAQKIENAFWTAFAKVAGEAIATALRGS